jgi:hypothetical protein
MENQLREHIFSTYLTLRYGIALVGALLPLVVYVVGAFHDIQLQKSISAYYWASSADQDEEVSEKDVPLVYHKVEQNPPSRTWFVGGLFAIAAFLYLYKGFSVAENIALNLAAILAAGVAVFPMEWRCGTACGKYSIHGFCAVVMFVLLFYVVWFRAADTLTLIHDDASQARYRRMYKIIGLAMLASPVTAFVLISVLDRRSSYTFFIEAAGIWAFSLYWWVKSSELKRTAGTIKALQGQVQGSPGRMGGAVTEVGGGEAPDAGKIRG